MTNLTTPGAGSLVAGRATGYAQLALTIGGMVLTFVFGARFILWYVANWSRIQASSADPISNLANMWHMVRWVVLGFGLFAFGWIWALMTSFGIVLSAKTAESAPVPPRLDPNQAPNSTQRTPANPPPNREPDRIKSR